MPELACGGIHVDVVIVDRHRRRRIRIEIPKSDAANEQRGVRRGEDRTDFEIRRELGDVRDILGPQRFKVVGVERGHRSPHVLQILGPALSCDENFLHPAVLVAVVFGVEFGQLFFALGRLGAVKFFEVRQAFIGGSRAGRLETRFGASVLSGCGSRVQQQRKRGE